MKDKRRQTAPAGYGASGNRTTFGYWVPLVLTVTAATVGLAAWIWSERSDEEDDRSSVGAYNPGGKPPPGYSSMSGGVSTGAGPAGPGGPPPPEWRAGQSSGDYQTGYNDSRDIRSQSTGVQQTGDSGLVTRTMNAVGINRAPSPGQAYDWASKTLTAGVAAAGAMIGVGAERKDGFDEQRRWSEEADRRQSSRDGRPELQRKGTAQEFYSGSVSLPRSASISSAKRKTIVIVVSSVQSNVYSDTDIGGHASILAHLPEHVHADNTRIFVLIYAPSMSVHPLSPAATSRRLSQSRTSSFSNISAAEAHTPAQTPGDFPDQDGILSHVDPQPIDETTTTLYKTLHNQALALVDRDTMIMPFASPQGHKHIIKSLSPEIVYIQEGLCGTDGEIVAELGGWVRTCVVVIGDEDGTGGLVDTDEEVERRRARARSRSGSRNGKTASKGEVWWKREERTGVGRGVAVVESIKIGEDWERRVNGKD